MSFFTSRALYLSSTLSLMSSIKAELWPSSWLVMASFDPYKSYNESTKDTDLLTLNTADIFNIIDIISYFFLKLTKYFSLHCLLSNFYCAPYLLCLKTDFSTF